MIYRNGKKVGAIFRNGQAISKVFRNGNLVWQKDSAEAKRIKSISVTLPEWGTVKRAEWESVLRALPEGIRGYSLVAVIRGVAVRLLGYGATPAGELAGDTITLPSNLYISSNDVHVGQSVSFVAKVPSVTSEPTYQHSNDSFKSYGFFLFKTAPFLPGSKLTVSLTPQKSSSSWTIEGSCGQARPEDLATGKNSYVVKTSGSYSAPTSSTPEQLTKEVTYSGEDYVKMVTHNTDFWLILEPRFAISASGLSRIGPVTLHSPESNLAFNFIIRKITTY